MNGWWQRLQVGVLTLGLAVSALVVQQTLVTGAPAESEQFTGRVVSVERKGGATKVVVDRDDGGGTLDITVTRATNFHSETKGDSRFFRNGCWVVTTATPKGNDLFADSFEIYLGKPKLSPQFQKYPTSPDYAVCGTVVGSDQFSVTLQIPPFGTRRILLDDKALDRIKVYIPNADYVEAGATVDLEGIMRGKKFSPQKVTVKIAKPLTVEQAFSKKRIDATAKADPSAKGADKEGMKAATAKPKPVAKGKKGKNGGDAADPFGFQASDPKKKK